MLIHALQHVDDLVRQHVAQHVWLRIRARHLTDAVEQQHNASGLERHRIRQRAGMMAPGRLVRDRDDDPMICTKYFSPTPPQVDAGLPENAGRNALRAINDRLIDTRVQARDNHCL